MTAEWVDEARRLGVPVEAWIKGRTDAANGVETSWKFHPVITAVAPGPPWLEPRFPPRRTPRFVTLHGGPFDGCDIDVWALGQTLAVVGGDNRVLYEHKEHDDTTATYTAVSDEEEGRCDGLLGRDAPPTPLGRLGPGRPVAEGSPTLFD